MATRSRRPAQRRTTCPCGGLSLDTCCGPVLADPGSAESPESLMRSRYTAYATANLDHLVATWHPDHRPAQIPLPPGIRWQGLTVLDATPPKEGPNGTTGWVTFEARCRDGQRRLVLRERSRFDLIEGRWLYVDGIALTPGGTGA